MYKREAERLYQDILGIWPKPDPSKDEQTAWGKRLVCEDFAIAERTLSYLEQEMVNGGPRTFRPALTEWVHRYRLLDKARAGASHAAPHDGCVSGLVSMPDEHYHAEDCPCTEGAWRPCTKCLPATYEKWQAGEFFTQPKDTERPKASCWQGAPRSAVPSEHLARSRSARARAVQIEQD